MEILCKRTDVRYFSFHALRHAGASLLDSAKVPIGTIQKVLGHENRTTTKIYLNGIGKKRRWDAMRTYESHAQSLTQAE